MLSDLDGKLSLAQDGEDSEVATAGDGCVMFFIAKPKGIYLQNTSVDHRSPFHLISYLGKTS